MHRGNGSGNGNASPPSSSPDRASSDAAHAPSSPTTKWSQMSERSLLNFHGGASFSHPRGSPKKSPVRIARLKMLQSAINTRNCNVQDRSDEHVDVLRSQRLVRQDSHDSLLSAQDDIEEIMGPLGSLTGARSALENAPPKKKQRTLPHHSVSTGSLSTSPLRSSTSESAVLQSPATASLVLEDRGYYRLSDRIGASYTPSARALSIETISEFTKREMYAPVNHLSASSKSLSISRSSSPTKAAVAMNPALERSTSPSKRQLDESDAEGATHNRDERTMADVDSSAELTVYVEGSRAFARHVQNSQGIFRAPSPKKPKKDKSRGQFPLALDDPERRASPPISPTGGSRVVLDPLQSTARTYEMEKKRYLQTMEAYWKQVDQYTARARQSPMDLERPPRILRRLQVPQPRGLDREGVQAFDERCESMIADIFQEVYADYYETVARSMLSYDLLDASTCLRMNIYRPFLRAEQKWWIDESFRSKDWRILRRTGLDSRNIAMAHVRIEQQLFAIHPVAIALQEQWLLEAPPVEWDLTPHAGESAGNGFASILFVDVLSPSFRAALPKTIPHFVDAVSRRSDLVKDCLKTCWIAAAARRVNECMHTYRPPQSDASPRATVSPGKSITKTGSMSPTKKHGREVAPPSPEKLLQDRLALEGLSGSPQQPSTPRKDQTAQTLGIGEVQDADTAKYHGFCWRA
ncbi:hypothetical protein PINS_up008683 [Pythium insidiosum]|nr:hypothetical protein PINS_up008683 [Pythium insidiosum]